MFQLHQCRSSSQISLAFLMFLPGPSEGFVRGRCDQVSIFKGRGNSSGCHQTADVSHVSHQVGINVGAELQERKGRLMRSLNYSVIK